MRNSLNQNTRKSCIFRSKIRSSLKSSTSLAYRITCCVIGRIHNMSNFTINDDNAIIADALTCGWTPHFLSQMALKEYGRTQQDISDTFIRNITRLLRWPRCCSCLHEPDSQMKSLAHNVSASATRVSEAQRINNVLITYNNYKCPHNICTCIPTLHKRCNIWHPYIFDPARAAPCHRRSALSYTCNLTCSILESHLERCSPCSTFSRMMLTGHLEERSLKQLKKLSAALKLQLAEHLAWPIF